jgi:hypothetical protein
MVESELISARSSLISLEDVTPTEPKIDSLESAQDDFSVLARGKTNFTEVFEQFRKDKAMKIGSSPEEHRNEINWHGLMKRRVLNQWSGVLNCLQGKLFTLYSKALKDAASEMMKVFKLHQSLTKIERGIGEIKEMVKAFDEGLNQVAKYHVEIDHNNTTSNSLPNGLLSNSTADGDKLKDSDPDFQSLVLEMVQCTQDIRQLSQSNTTFIQKSVFTLADN